MHTFESIMERLKEAEVNTVMLPKKELKALPEVLTEDEEIHYLVQGMYNNGVGILCATDKRMLFIDKGLIFGLKVEEFPLRTLTSVSHETGVLMGKVKIYSSGNNAEITHVDKAGAKAFVSVARELLDNITNSGSPHPNNEGVAHKSSMDKIESLERLASLKDKGILSEEEFQAEKTKIMQG